jgi:hypothetical protein
MMIGPAPIVRTEWMSVRFGICLNLRFAIADLRFGKAMRNGGGLNTDWLRL